MRSAFWTRASRANAGKDVWIQPSVSRSTNTSIFRAGSHSASAGTTDDTISFTGLQMMPAARIICLERNSTLPARAGVEKKLLIAFGASQMARTHAENFEGTLGR